MLHFEGLGIAAILFLIIGIFHPLVIKGEYYFGLKVWKVFCAAGIVCLVLSVMTAHLFLSALLGVLAATCLWSIKEVFEQKDRVKKGWHPKNPKRDYSGY